MEAVAQGMAAALGGPPWIVSERIAAGSAVADARMLALMNAVEDLTDVSRHCCSFAAWGHNPQHDTPLSESLLVVNFWMQRETPSPQPCPDCAPRYQAMVPACRQGPIASIKDMQKVLIACDPTHIALESVYVEPDVGLIHVAFRSGPDAPASPHLTPVTFRWEDLLAPIPD